MDGALDSHMDSGQGGLKVTAFRSFVFQIAFYLAIVFYLLAFLPLLPFLSRHALWMTGVRAWVATNLFLLRIICGTRVAVTGRENIPKGPLLIASKHQSAWETFALLPMFTDPAFVLKRELMQIPVFGWYLKKMGMIPVDRTAGMSALKDMAKAAQAAIDEGRQVLIFPEGTRQAPGAPPDYKPGAAYLYSVLKAPCLPVALNSGLFWPRRAMTRRAGTIRVSILPAIPAGLKRADFSARLEHDIETESRRLLDTGLAELGPRAPEALREGDGSSPFSTPVENP